MYTILGIILIAIGSYAIYFGATKADKKTQQEITDKIVETQHQIEALKIEPNIDQTEVKNINNEFSSWADNFIKNKEKEIVKLDKTDVVLREEMIRLNNEWHDIYSNFFSTLTKMIEAYKKASGHSKILIKENPELPANVYNARPDKFKVIVQFNKSLFWVIWLKVKEPIKDETIPSINIDVVKDEDLKYKSFNWGDLSLIPSTDNMIRVETMNTFDKANFNNQYEFGKEKKELNDLLKKAFEYQILLIEK